MTQTRMLNTNALASLMIIIALLAPAIKAQATQAEPAAQHPVGVRVVASFKPVHSLVAAVMQGAGAPRLLVQAGSPHSYSLKPSDARALQQADIVVWVGEELERFLVGPLETLASRAKILTLDKAPDLTLYAFRKGGDWRRLQHDEHEHQDQHQDEHHNHQPANDPHLWLDPQNARAFVKAIRDALIAADPANGALYRRNAARTSARLDSLTAELQAKLAPLKDRPYIVFHDSFQYFEKRFGLNGVGAVAVNPQKQPGARHLMQLKRMVRRLNVACVFTEPQFRPKLADIIVEGSGARIGRLDPVGAKIKAGPELYFKLLRANADDFSACMQP